MNESINRRIGKKDLILLAVLLGVFLVLFFAVRAFSGRNGTVVLVTVAGEEYGSYRLDEEQTVEIMIDGTVTNTLVIRDGRADMISANCPDKLCVHQHAISRGNENIVCLPNKVVAAVVMPEEDEGDGVDVIVQ